MYTIFMYLFVVCNYGYRMSSKGEVERKETHPFHHMMRNQQNT